MKRSCAELLYEWNVQHFFLMATGTRKPWAKAYRLQPANDGTGGWLQRRVECVSASRATEPGGEMGPAEAEVPEQPEGSFGHAAHAKVHWNELAEERASDTVAAGIEEYIEGQCAAMDMPQLNASNAVEWGGALDSACGDADSADRTPHGPLDDVQEAILNTQEQFGNMQQGVGDTQRREGVMQQKTEDERVVDGNDVAAAKELAGLGDFALSGLRICYQSRRLNNPHAAKYTLRFDLVSEAGPSHFLVLQSSSGDNIVLQLPLGKQITRLRHCSVTEPLCLVLRTCHPLPSGLWPRKFLEQGQCTDQPWLLMAFVAPVGQGRFCRAMELLQGLYGANIPDMGQLSEEESRVLMDERTKAYALAIDDLLGQ